MPDARQSEQPPNTCPSTPPNLRHRDMRHRDMRHRDMRHRGLAPTQAWSLKGRSSFWVVINPSSFIPAYGSRISCLPKLVNKRARPACMSSSTTTQLVPIHCGFQVAVMPRATVDRIDSISKNQFHCRFDRIHNQGCHGMRLEHSFRAAKLGRKRIARLRNRSQAAAWRHRYLGKGLGCWRPAFAIA